MATTPEAGLARARAATQPRVRAKYAREGLTSAGRASETRWLLLRQLYLAHLEVDEFAQARQIAREMVQFPPLADVAWHDAARAAFATADWEGAREDLCAAAKRAPLMRRFDHELALARLEAYLGRPQVALLHLQRAERGRKRADPSGCLFAAKVVWQAAAGTGTDRRRLARAYQSLFEHEQRPLLGDYLGGQLLTLLGREADAAQVHRDFLRAVRELGVIARLGLMPEIHGARKYIAPENGFEPRPTLLRP